jgi:hypothetical protein
VSPRSGWVSAGSLARRSGPKPMAVSTQSAALSEEAQRIQATHRSWLVMWSAWHQTFTAFCCISPVPLIVDEPTADALISEMLRVELHYSPTRIDAFGGVVIS